LIFGLLFFFPSFDLTNNRLAQEARQQQIASSRRSGVSHRSPQRSSPQKDRNKRTVRRPEIEMGYDHMPEGSLMEQGSKDKKDDGGKSLNS